jgi:two-component system, NtrC family, response regulator AtoC
MRVLIVDDEKNLRESLADFLKIDGIETECAENGLAAQRLLSESVFDAAILDLRMPGLSGLELLDWLREQGPEVPVVMISAFGDIDDAVSAMKLGARDYIVKPFNPEELAIRLKRIVSERRLVEAEAVRNFGKPGGAARRGSGLVGRSRSIEEVKNLIDRVAPTNATVLITGESGTGKEVTARSLHALSPRKDGPFIPVNVGGIPETLLESELFGYERGAFTGAETRKPGIFELANQGTLFLDEIADMPQALQVKLLRAVQEKKIRRLGGTKDMPTDIRIIAATNRDIEEAVRAGSFREDLYYRINVIRIRLPPLRDRIEDLPDLCEALVEKLDARLGRKVIGVSRGALELLASYRFPGNVRELENLLERAIILCTGDLVTERNLLLPTGTSVHFARPGNPAGDHGAFQLPTVNLEELERAAIIQALLRWEGKREKAARELGISRRTLLNKTKEYGM